MGIREVYQEYSMYTGSYGLRKARGFTLPGNLVPVNLSLGGLGTETLSVSGLLLHLTATNGEKTLSPAFFHMEVPCGSRILLSITNVLDITSMLRPRRLQVNLKPHPYSNSF